MSFSLRPHQLVAHWVPGFVLLLLILALRPSVYTDLKILLPPDSVRASVGNVLAFVLGQLLDSLRNLSEWLWDCLAEINWDFFADAERKKVDQLEDFFFTYYVFSSNLVLPLLAFFLVAICRHYGAAVVILIALATLISAFDALFLRKEIVKHTNAWRPTSLFGAGRQ